MTILKFNTAEEMLKCILNDTDIYNIETTQYIFHYNEEDAIAVYYLNKQEAKQIAQKAGETEYWSDYLGVGGSIYNDPQKPEFNTQYHISNLDYCRQYYSQGTWIIADLTYLTEGEK